MSNMFRVVITVVALLSTLALSACVGPAVSSPEKIQRALSMNTSGTAGEYVLGVTDEVLVSVWRNPDLSITVPVRPDGMISVPLVGDVLASGKTPQELGRSIETALGRFIREPQVSIVVTSMGSHEYTDRVRVTGAVMQPMSVPHRDGITVLDVLLSAGGTNPYAAANDARLYRVLHGDVVSIPVRLEDILNRGDISTNYPLRAGDILTVPERSF